jgi:predicted NUDIX family NTP pyrophosphohydrolase
MSEQSAGVLVYRRAGETLEVLLVHPGGPFGKNKDAGAWSIPKGLFEAGEEPLAAARREFAEETGVRLEGDFRPLGSARQPSGKVVHAWALRAEVDAEAIISNTFELEWPPKSGRKQQFPEVDRAAWFPLAEAYDKILKGQKVFLDRLASAIAHG